METKIVEGSIEDFNNVMTIFYGKETGNIRGYALGRQDLKTYYGDSLGDFNYGAIVVPKDNYVLNNLENDKLLLKHNPELSKYEVAK